MSLKLLIGSLLVCASSYGQQAIGTNYTGGVSFGSISTSLGRDLNGDGFGITNVTLTTPAIYGYVDAQTNSWTTNTAIPLGFTNLLLLSAANTACGITGVANNPNTTTRYCELTVIASGDVVFTNPASIHFNDGLTSRTITNGTSAEISVKVYPGQKTNAAISFYP